METVAQNYARRQEPIHTRQFELIGDLILDSAIIGSVDPKLTDAGMEGVVIMTNIDLSRGSLELKFSYHMQDNFYMCNLILSDIGRPDRLGMVTKLLMGDNNVPTNNVKICSKKVINPETNVSEWNIVIKPTIPDSMNIYTLWYVASSVIINKPSDQDNTTYVKCRSGIIMSDGTNPEENGNIVWLRASDPSVSMIPVGTIVAWYPKDNVHWENPQNGLDQLTDEWKVCDGTQKFPDGSNVPDLRGRFIMGWGKELGNNADNSSMKNMKDTGEWWTSKHNNNTMDVPQISSKSHLGPFNSRPSRGVKIPQPQVPPVIGTITEGVDMETGEVNCGKIGNTGGVYTVKNLPKQQGSLMMGWRYGKGDNSTTNYAPFNAFSLAWAPYHVPFKNRPTIDMLDRFQMVKNGDEGNERLYEDRGPDVIFGGSDNVQGGIAAQKVGGNDWKYGRAYLSEGAAPHDNKPPYIVMAYIIKVK